MVAPSIACGAEIGLDGRAIARLPCQQYLWFCKNPSLLIPKNMMNTRLFANLEQLKADLLAQLKLRQHNHSSSVEVQSKREQAISTSRLQGFTEGIEYALAAIDDYLNTPEQYKK